MRRPTLWTLAAALSLGLAALAATAPPANLPQALEAQRRLVADHPTAAAYNDLGNLLVLAGEEEEAEAAYAQAVELDPDTAAYHYNFALLLQQVDRPGDALEHLRAVVEIDPSNAWATYQVGAIHEARDRRSEAIEWYGRAFRLDPDLAFPDVNPHVIESELTAEAMLRGYRAGLVDSAAPRIYQEPGRISALLVTPPATAVATADEPVPTEPILGQEPGRTAGFGQARPLPGGATAGDAEREPRVLTEEDLLIGPLNQAAPQDQPSYRPPARGARGGGTTVVVPGTVGTPDPDAGRDVPRRPIDPPRERVIVPREGAPFRPGLPSTGRLDTLLVEETERIG